MADEGPYLMLDPGLNLLHRSCPVGSGQPFRSAASAKVASFISRLQLKSNLGSCSIA